MFIAGYIQDIYLNIAQSNVVITACCFLDKRKERHYNITIKLEPTSADIQLASCDCVAVKGLKTSCKHIAELFYALEDLVRTFTDDTKPVALSCTDKLMDWNKPRKRKLSPKRLNEIDFSVE